MRFSPDGRTLAVGLAEGAVELWDVATRSTTATLKESSHWVHSVAFSSDGATLASASVHEGTVRLWNLATENAVVLEDHGATVTFVRFSPDGTRLAVGSYGAVTLWNVLTGGATRVLVAKEWGRWWTSGAFSPDGKTLAATERSDVWLWDLDRGTPSAVLEGEHRVTSVSFSPDGATVAAAQVDGTVQLWDVATGQPIYSTAFEGKGEGPLSVAFLPNGTLLASGELASTVRLWDGSTGTSLATLEGKEVGGNSLSLSPDGTVFVTKSSNNRNLQLWDLAAGRRIATLEHSGVSFLTFSSDGTLLVSGTTREVMLWDVATGTNLGTLEGTGVTSMSLSPDGRTFASGGDNGVTLLWDLQLILPRPQTLIKLSGNKQQGLTKSTLSQPLVVSVFDQNGDPFNGAEVIFSVTAGEGTLSETTATTNSLGRAATTLTLGGRPGITTVTAEVAELKAVIFSATALAVPTSLTKVSGDEQEAPAGAALSQPFVVEVRDQIDNPLEGAQIAFTITAGSGTLSATTATTAANGRASTTLTFGSEPETVTVAATVAELEPVTFTASVKATADFDGDGETGFSDFFLFADAFGGSDSRFDLDGSGTVDFADFFLLADYFANPEARGKLLALAREMIGLPQGPQLQQNAPNPFNSQTVISWFQLLPGPARVEVFALTGQRVAVLHQGPTKAGVHRVNWDGRDNQGRPLASGVYLYRLLTGKAVQTRKLTLLQ